ncbi:MAG: carboxylesterase [Alphaproteobacteria bacterium RIFCSPHIGHO2_12_FULL_63_12]|nr:MAG: carboxylesterase [Alphaproteobacteria bacterium RIFCSPHIGHO2_12_FULL_63_12]
MAAALLFSAAAARVQTDTGLVEGVAENGVTVFKGIPFAAAPVGALRWRAPEPPASWPGVWDADRFAPICPQTGAYPDDSPPEPQSEDCLYLNIWAPANARAGAPLPVMVWIHGGGLLNGSGSNPVYAGDALARRGVIVVTFNYRLGALGFLAHTELSLESPKKISGNYGHLDQIAALEWVQRNIAAFGGDPANVTVFGQSSGAISISALIASPLAKGLFHRAIGQSGGLFEPLDAAPEFKLAGAQEVGAAFAQRLGAPTLEKMRAAPVNDILEQRFYPQATIDGYFLAETPFETFAAGRQNAVDALVGSNEGEGLYFIAGREVNAANMTDELKRDFPPFIVSLIGPKPQPDDAAARAAFIAFEGDMRFSWNMRTWARLAAASGRSAYLYRFAATPPGEEGASHGAELRYVFGNPPASGAWADKDRALSQTLIAYWTNFAATGDPNGEGLSEWPRFAAPDERALLIGDEIAAGALENAESLNAIDRLYAAVRFALNYGYAVAAVAALLILLVLYKIAAALARALRRR